MCRECFSDPQLASECGVRRTEHLRSLPLFSALEDPQLETLVESVVVHEVSADGWLYFQGDPADCFFFVEEGQIALLRHSSSGDEVIVTIVGPGETFEDETVLLDDPRRAVSCRALTASRLLCFDRELFSRLVDESPRLARQLLLLLHRRNQMLLDEIEQKTLQSATERLMAFLVREATDTRSPRVSLTYPKRVLAARLSIKPETLSRIFSKLQKCDLLDIEGNEITLVQPAALREGLSCETCCRRFWGCPGAVAKSSPALAGLALRSQSQPGIATP